MNRPSNQAWWHQMCSEWGHAHLQGSLRKGTAHHSVRCKYSEHNISPGLRSLVSFFVVANTNCNSSILRWNSQIKAGSQSISCSSWKDCFLPGRMWCWLTTWRRWNSVRWMCGQNGKTTVERFMRKTRRVQEVECNVRRSNQCLIKICCV